MKIKLKEEQIQNLIKGYKILSEQSNSQGFNPTTKTETINFNSVWATGKYKLTPTQINAMKPELDKVVAFLKENPTAKLSMEIIAGESRVTNYDREKCSGTGDFREECKLKEGDLGNFRAKELYNYLLKYFQELKNNNVITTLPNKPTTKVIIGKTPYVTGKDKPSDPRYLQEQFVKLNISASASYECLVGMDITVAYYQGRGHQCDEAIFGLKVNGQLLGIVNLNNGPMDTGQTTVPGMGQLKKEIKIHNHQLISTEVGELAIREYKKWFESRAQTRISRFTDATINIPELDLNDVKVSELPEEKDYTTRVSNQTTLKYYLSARYIRTKDFKGKIVYDPEKIVDESFVAALQKYRSFLGKKMGEIDVVDRTVESLKNLEGRTTDGRVGGTRTQTFKLDTAIAQKIVANAPVKDRLIITLIPKVDQTGPYRMFYQKGSHSEVPSVKIVGKNGDVRYNDTPNLEMERGSMAETTILQTDLCGNKID